MKKITLLLAILVCFSSSQVIAQVLNESANWPNANWTITGTFNNDPTAFEADPTITANFAFDDDDAGLGNDDNIAAESPVIDLTPAFTAGEIWITISGDFVYNYNFDDILQFEYWDADASTWNIIGLPFNADTAGAPLNDFCSGTPEAYTTDVLNIAGFTATQLSGFKYRIYWDDTVGGTGWEWGFCFQSPTLTSQIPPTCADPSGLAFISATSTTANLSWLAGATETAWEVVIQPQGTGIPTGSGDMATTNNPYIAMGLMPATSYEYYVRSDCGGGDYSAWVGPVNFDTECTTFTAPYTEGFENAGDIPLCWTMSGGEDWEFSDNPAGEHIGDNGTITGTTATNNFFAWVDASGNDGPTILNSPFVDVSGLTTPALSFYIISDNEGDANSTLEVEVWDGAAWNLVNTYNSNTAGWELQTIDLSTLTITGDVQVRFTFSETVTGDFSDDIAIDDVTIDELPTCPNPTDLTFVSATATTANLSWTLGDSETAWEVAIQPQGTGVPTGSGDMATANNPYIAMGLTPSTSYEAYVRADCGGDYSIWVGPVNFDTECSTFTAPYTEGFENAGDIPLCWTMSGGEDWEFSDNPAGEHIGDNGTITGTTATNNFFAWVDASGNDGPTILNSPFVDISGLTTPALSFYIISDNEGDANSTLEVEVWDGAAWNLINTYNSNTAGWELQTIDLSTLTITGDVQVRFTFSETVTGDFSDDIAIDDVTIDELPTCPNPSDLTVSNLTTTSAEVSWTALGSATSWNIEYGLTGFTQGMGTTISPATNPYTIMGLTPDTEYQYYVQSNCDTDGLSGWVGPFSFFTGYCESIPTSSDGNGVANVTIGSTDFPSLGDNVTYEDQTSPIVNIFQGIDATVLITFETGFTYGTNIWIDFNDNLIFEPSELVYQGESTGANPTTLDATFTVPITAALGQHRMRIGTADSGQATPNPCYSGTWGVTLDFTVNIEQLSCTLPEANFTLVEDCDNSQIFIDVDITSLGDATSLAITNDFDTTSSQAMSTGIYQMGPFPLNQDVKIYVINEQDNDCTISSEIFNLFTCPAQNDDCIDATIATVNDSFLSETVTSGTLFDATASSNPPASCGGDADDDVWFEFEANSEYQLISIVNLAGSETNNIDFVLYEGDCNSLTEIDCTSGFQLLSNVTPQLTIGSTYYIRVFSEGSNAETTTFDLSIVPYIAPANITCDATDNLCPGAGDLYTYNSLDLPSLGQIDCLFTSPNPTFSILEIGSDGNIEIEMVQNTAFDINGNPIGDELDVDFALWGPYTTDDYCNGADYPSITPFACSYSAAPVENFTITNAAAGDIYIVLITNFEEEPGIIQINQTNLDPSNPDPTVGTLSGEVSVDLTSNEAFFIDDDSDPTTPSVASLCGYPSIGLEADSPFADVFEWSVDGVIDTSLTTENITVTESGTYSVTAYDSQCMGSDTKTVVVNLYKEPIVNTVPPDETTIVTCDDESGNGIEEFDLSSLSSIILDSPGQNPSDFLVTYHETLNGAQTGNDAINFPYSATDGATIYVRVEDVNSVGSGSGCASTNTNFNLVVLGALPTITGVQDVEACDDDNDETSTFDLELNTPAILNGQDPTVFLVTYHDSQTNADAGTDALTSPYTNTSNPQTIYARITNSAASDCYKTTTFDIRLAPKPVLAQADNLISCDNDLDGIANYNLTENDSVIANGQTGFTFSYYTSLTDAETSTDAILDPTNYDGGNETIYVRVEDPDSCFEVGTFDLTYGTLPETSFDSNIAYEVCPNATVPITVTAIGDNYTEADVTIEWSYEGTTIAGQTDLTLDTVLLEGDYEITVTFNDPELPCSASTTVTVYELETCIIPQGISPDGDGLNDTFDLSNLDVQELKIYNRNGRLVYEKTNYKNEWHGQSLDGDELPVGTYYYTMQYEKTKTKSAWVYINK